MTAHLTAAGEWGSHLMEEGITMEQYLITSETSPHFQVSLVTNYFLLVEFVNVLLSGKELFAVLWHLKEIGRREASRIDANTNG